MSITNSEQLDFMRDHVAPGFITGFTVTNLGLLNLNQSVSGSGGLSGQTLLIQPKSRFIASSRVADGLVFRPDGTIFNPWGLAGERAPAAYPQYTQTFVYHGHPAITMQYYEKLLGRVGLTGTLHLSYGRVAGESFGVKYCPAMLLTVSAAAERVLDSSETTTKTLMEFSATWQQTGAFTY